MRTASLAKLVLDCGVNVIHMRACYVCRLMSRESVGAVFCVYSVLYYCHYYSMEMLRTHVLCIPVPWRVTLPLNTLSNVGSSNTEHLCSQTATVLTMSYIHRLPTRRRVHTRTSACMHTHIRMDTNRDTCTHIEPERAHF